MEQIERIENLRGLYQPAMLNEAPGALRAIADGTVKRIQPWFFTGPAGCGKTHAAEKTAALVDGNFIEVRANDIGAIEKIAEKACALTADPNQINIWFLDEWHNCTEAVRNFFLKACNTSQNPLEGGKEETAWVWNQSRNLVIFATNRGDADPAFVGEVGRCLEILFQPVPEKHVRKVFAFLLAKLAPQYGAPRFSVTAMEALLKFTGRKPRAIENALLSILAMAYGNGANYVSHLCVLQWAKRKGRGLNGLGTNGLHVLKTLALYGATGEQLKRLQCKAGMAQAKKSFDSAMDELKTLGFATLSRAALQVITIDGIEALRMRDRVLDILPVKGGRK